MMGPISCLLAGCVLSIGAATAEPLYRPGRRICASASRTGAELITQSFIQPVYSPLMTLCDGQRVCSTYRTTYKVSYRQVPKRATFPLYSCCPGWRRTKAHTYGCHKVSCRVACQNEGICIGISKCDCPPGWTGNRCQTDVDECTNGGHQCVQRCVNTPGSFHCECLEGNQLSEDGKSCLSAATPTRVASPRLNATEGDPEIVNKEMQELRNKIEVLEQKFQLVLAPFHTLLSASENKVDPIGLLTHSLQQLDRIDSLSEQISFLEERLETCSCKNEL